jgi:hypothetical protein
MKRFSLCVFLSVLMLGMMTLPVLARIGDETPQSAAIAKAHGVSDAQFTLPGDFAGNSRSRIIGETWFAPHGGWSFSQADAYTKIILGHRRLLKRQDEREKGNGPIEFRFSRSGYAGYSVESGRVTEIDVLTGGFDGDNPPPDDSYVTFSLSDVTEKPWKP